MLDRIESDVSSDPLPHRESGTKSIGFTAHQFVCETLHASHPKKNFAFNDKISHNHLLSMFRWCLFEDYDDCQNESQHNLAKLFVVFVKERKMFGDSEQALTVI